MKVLAEVLSAMAESGGLAEEERKGSAGGLNDDESDIRGNSSASAVIRASDSTSFSIPLPVANSAAEVCSPAQTAQLCS